jgi:phosphatidylglycerophosphatase A
VRVLLSSPAAFLALGGGAGLVPVAPGTAGTLLAVPLVWLVQLLPGALPWLVWGVACGIGLWACDRAGRMLGDPDHPAIVWDEVCGMALVLLLAPSGWGWTIGAVLAFRLFDIAKPWPIHLIDRRLPNGLGAMGDDLLAGLFAAGLLALCALALALV